MVSVNGCQDVKLKAITAPNGVPQLGVWLINTGGSGGEGKEDAAAAGQKEGGASWAQVDHISSV